MLQSEGLIYSQHSLIRNLFDEESHTGEDLSRVGRRLFVKLARPLKNRGYAHFMFNVE